MLAHLAARLDVPMAANAISVAGSSPFVVTRQVVGGAALEEMALDAVAGRLHRRRPLLERHTRREPDDPELGRVHPGDRRAGPPRPRHRDRPEGGRPLRLAEVRARRGGRRTRRRQRRRLRPGQRARRDARRITRGVARGHQPRLAPAPRAGRPDRQPDRAGDLHPLRHQRRHPALGRLCQLQGDPRRQHRRRGADDDEGELRRRRRHARGRAGDHRGAEAARVAPRRRAQDLWAATSASCASCRSASLPPTWCSGAQPGGPKM